MNIHQQLEPLNWAQRQFSEIKFSDKRRTRRLIKIATNLASHPGLSIPQQFENPYDIKAAYNLFKHPESKPKLLQSHHNENVLKTISKEGVYLLIEDTTQLSWSGQEERKGLGSIASGTKGGQGFLLHTTLAVKWSTITNFKRPNVEVIGLANQEYFFRSSKGSLTKKEKERENVGFGEDYNGETELWNKIFGKLSIPKEKVRWVRVCDRGADIYEVLLNSYKNGYGFVIRASRDRVLEERGKERLFERARKGRILGEYQIELRSRKEQPARMVNLELSVSQIKIRSPRRKNAEPGSLPTIALNVVRVVEKNNINGPKARDIVSAGNEYVVDIDLSKFFDRINHDRLIHRLKIYLKDSRILRLIGMILRSGIMSDGVITTPSEGSVQGSSLSPLLSNIVLDELDKELERRGLQFCRYPDDSNIFVRSQKAAERVMCSIKKFIENKLKLKVNEDKSKIAKSDKVKFLAMTIVNAAIAISRKALGKAMEKVKELTPRKTHISLEQAMETINKWYQGWASYFKMTQYPAQLKKIEAHIRRRLRARIVAQQKRRRHLFHKLIKLRVNKRLASKTAYSNNKTWVLSHTRAL